MRRLTSYTVRVGFTVAWFLAASPIKRSLSVNATYEGVMRLPCHTRGEADMQQQGKQDMGLTHAVYERHVCRGDAVTLRCHTRRQTEQQG